MRIIKGYVKPKWVVALYKMQDQSEDWIDIGVYEEGNVPMVLKDAEYAWSRLRSELTNCGIMGVEVGIFLYKEELKSVLGKKVKRNV